ncbi:hypothetical protein [Citricoccus muralis]|uniref:Uncharacterized protein n=1 Tax=Citricoccus muralis TaxID=169134 RepID=A0A3D9L7H9_9MICC|nr:hypothetical protein [Citricoccus muralis]REE02298.1 hypothetical protein C8E99_0065 [Citricoccus muralis]
MSHDDVGPKKSVNSVLAYRFIAFTFAACAVSFGFTQSWGAALPFLVLASTFFILGEEEKKRTPKAARDGKAEDGPEG